MSGPTNADLAKRGYSKTVYTVTERAGKSYWTRIGRAYVNADGSLNVQLECLPISGTMQIRDTEPQS